MRILRFFWWFCLIFNVLMGCLALWVGNWWGLFSYATVVLMLYSTKRQVIVVWSDSYQDYNAYISHWTSPKGDPRLVLHQFGRRLNAIMEQRHGDHLIGISWDPDKRLFPLVAMRLRISVPALKHKMRKARLVAQWKEEGRKWTFMWLIWHELRRKASRVSSYVTRRSGAVRKLRSWRVSRAVAPTVNA